MPQKFNLEERLLNYAARIIAVAKAMERSRAANHVADQLVRSGTSPFGNHGEAEGAESRDDFIHKMRVCYKELRESRRWTAIRAQFIRHPYNLAPLLGDADELIRIFAASIRTAERNGRDSGNV